MILVWKFLQGCFRSVFYQRTLAPDSLTVLLCLNTVLKGGSPASLLVPEKADSVSWSDCKWISFISCTAALVSLHRCKCHGREGPQEGGRCKARTDAFGSRAVQISLGWLRFPPLGCVHVSTENETGASRGLLISRWTPVTVCVGQEQTVAKETLFKLNWII